MSELQLKPDARLVATSEALAELSKDIATAPALALDTEFVRERTYFPELCLIQIATNDTIAAVDCLCDTDLQEFYQALGARQRPWVLHSSRQDLEILSQAGIELPDELIDTQIAAALLGMSTQLGYAQLVEDILGVRLNKAHTRTDWRRRPIAAAALDYAIDDVRYLLPLWQHLKARLEERNRHRWFSEDCAALLARYRAGDDDLRWQRIKGIRGLDQTSQSVARELSDWREAQAARINRPRQWLLSDEALVSLARGRPETGDDLGRDYGLSAKFRDRHGHRLLEAIDRGLRRRSSHERLTATPLTRAERQELKVLAEAVKQRATALGLAPEILATRQEITDLMRGSAPARLASGWRAEQLRDLTR